MCLSIYKPNKEKMKKVGIITFHCADNFGAVLQVYALQQILIHLDVDSEIIDFRPERLTIPYDYKSHWTIMIKKVGHLRTLISSIYRRANKKKIKSRMLAFKNFRDNYLILSNSSYYTPEELRNSPPKYDFYIVGSDQVWNPSYFMHARDSYFLDFAPKESIKISYAASIAEKVHSDFNDIFKSNISRFDYVSIREKEHVNFLKTVTNKSISVVLDPTLLLEQLNYKQVSINPKIEDKYILVYDIQSNTELVKLANRISREKGYNVISFSNPKNYTNGIKTFAYEGPSEFLGYIENAEFVLSTSFHGVALSVIYQKPFYTIPHTTRGSRITDLLVSIGLEERIIYKSTELKSIEYEIDYKKPMELLNKRKSESINFLIKALDVKI